MLTRLRPLLAVLLWAVTAPAVTASPDDFVIIIANQDYRGTVPKVEYADRDAEALAKAAREVLKVPGDRIVIERNLTYAGFLAWFGRDGEGGPELERVKARLGRSSTIVFFYSGHGMPAKRSASSDAEAVLLPVDTPPALAGTLGYTVANIRRALSASQREKAPDGRVVVLLEACFSGSSGAGRIAAETSSVRIGVSASRSSEPSLVEIAAAGPDQEANWDRERRLGLFTDALVDGLYGAADADRDGHVTAAELAAFVTRRIDDRVVTLFPSPRRYQTPTLAGMASARIASVSASTPSRDPEAEARRSVRCATVPRSSDPDEVREFLGSCGADCPCRAELEARLIEVERAATVCRVEGDELDRLAKRGSVAKGQVDALAASATCPDVKARAEQVAAALRAPSAPPAQPPPQPSPAATSSVPGRVPIDRVVVRLRQSYVVDTCGFVITSTARSRALGRGVYEAQISIDGTERAVRSGDLLAPSGSTGSCKIVASVRPSGDIELNGECQCALGGAKLAPVSPPKSAEPSARFFRDNKLDHSVCSECPEMAAIPAGTFLMGAVEAEAAAEPSERPARKMTLARPFALGRHEVTFAEWDACVGAKMCTLKPADEGWGRGRQPVVNVSAAAIRDYLTFLAAVTGQPYRLPTEAEWEYAARAGTATRFHTGDVLTGKDANVERSRGRATPVGSYAPNAFGLFDMHGNVWEIVADCWGTSLNQVPEDGRPFTGHAGSAPCEQVVMRGGSWNFPAIDARASIRQPVNRAYSVYSIGFRVARDLP